jgi:hypothetical protein
MIATLQREYQQALAELAVHEKAWQVYEKRQQTYADLEGRYESALAERERQIKAADPKLALEMHRLADEVRRIESQAEQVANAIETGEEASRAVAHVLGFLNSAASYGTADMVPLIGGKTASIMKHAKLAGAQASAQGAEKAIRDFQRSFRQLKELGLDVPIHDDLKIDMGKLATALDIFMGGILSAAVVRARIERTRATVFAASREVDEALAALRGSQAGLRNRIADIEDYRRQLLEKSGTGE